MYPKVLQKVQEHNRSAKRLEKFDTRGLQQIRKDQEGLSIFEN